jgi:NAD+ synthase (glutamine-hydrolysing)
MYGVNVSIPKTLVRFLIAHEATAHEAAAHGANAQGADAHRAEKSGAELQALLKDVLDTPVSPELLPAENGEIAQKTEELVGPYELHDFFLYYMVRWGFAPEKIFRLARIAFERRYDSATILKWLKSFYRRFFAQQFKRSCLPDGPKVGTVTLSPRGDWRMPSDASASMWLSALEKL